MVCGASSVLIPLLWVCAFATEQKPHTTISPAAQRGAYIVMFISSSLFR
jgi:hypothetical protein